MRVWLIFVIVGAGTLALRISIIALWSRLGQIPKSVERGLRFIPPAVLSALVLPSLAAPDGAITIGPRLAAGAVAFAVAWKTKNVLATIVVGMVALWAFQAL
jgi:branched-subunit amino acid transport protein